ncbi:MAG: biosynthetic peptidoglycan transglycosylase [Bacteroidota bacterium]
MPSLVIVAGLGIALWALRSYALQAGTEKFRRWAQHRLDLDLHLPDAQWEGWSTLYLPRMYGLRAGDTVLTAEQVRVHLPASVFFGGSRRPEGLEVAALRYDAHNLGFAFSGELNSENVDVEVRDLRMQHVALARDEVRFPALRLRGTMEAAEFSVADWRSEWQWTAGNGRVALEGKSALQPMQDVLAALPDGLAPRLADMAVRGRVGGELRLAADVRDWASLELQVSATDEGLEVADFGRSGLDSLKSAWMAAPRDWVQLADLPPSFVPALCFSEDAFFDAHHGIDTSILRRAVLDNLAEGRFVRGGGTLTMQLIRNVLLNKQKQVGRKIEELFLAALLERTHLLSKDEILTYYINIIEWGPDIYGLRAASQHYFQKSPQDLNLDETLLLTAMIPNPKMAHTLTHTDGTLTAETAAYFETMRFQLYLEEVISEEEWLVVEE